MDQWEAEGQFPAHRIFKLLGNAGFLGVNKPVGKEVFTLERRRSRRGDGRHPAAAFPAVTAGPGDDCPGRTMAGVEPPTIDVYPVEDFIAGVGGIKMCSIDKL